MTSRVHSQHSIFGDIYAISDQIKLGVPTTHLDWANSAVDGFGNPICKFVRLPRNNNKDVSMLVSRFLFLLIFKSEHSCLGSENWVRILSGGLLPREFTANTAFSGTSMPSRIKSSWEFQPHTLYVCAYVYVYIQFSRSLSGGQLPFVYFASRSFLEPCRNMRQSKFLLNGVCFGTAYQTKKTGMV